jgi:hypothetical protein
MRPKTLTVTGTGVSNVYVPDRNTTPFAIGMGAVVSATATYTVQHTFDDVFSRTFDPATATWFSHPTLVNQSANADSNYAFPVRGIRLNVSASTGSVSLTIVQAG